MCETCTIFLNLYEADHGDVITKIVYDDTPVRVYMDKVINSLINAYAISFKELLYNSNGKVEIIGIFLALLELVRLKRLNLSNSGF